MQMTEEGNSNPQWNKWLNWGEDSWSRLSITICDYDAYSKDSLSNTSTYYFPTHGSKMHIRKPCNTGYIELDYFLCIE